MTDEEQPDENVPHATGDVRQAAPVEEPVAIAELMRYRLEESSLSEPVKALVREALGDCEPRRTSTVSRIYLDSVEVTGFRGIGPKTRLSLVPKPGVHLVVGRNGSGKSSFAEGIEAAFTGVNGRWHGLHASRSSNWRNLHHVVGEPKVEAQLTIGGDDRRSTLTRTWDEDNFDASRGEFKRPGHGCVPVDQVDWNQALEDYRPFLSYVDLDRMISGKPAQMYDSIASILGLSHLSEADALLRQEKKKLEDAAATVKAELPELKDALYELQDDERAVHALVAIDTPGSPDFEALEALVAGLPNETDEGLLAELRLEAGVQGPDVGEVDAAVARLNQALSTEEDVRGTKADDARRRADLLDRALSHSDLHVDEDACPVCGTKGALDEEWAASAAAQITVLRQEAKAADDARDELRRAAQAVRNLIHGPQRIPASLAEAWGAWTACRAINDPRELSRCVHKTTATLADACDMVSRNAAKELEKRDERWRRLIGHLAAWAEAARTAEENDQRRKDLGKARTWIKQLSTELRERRMKGFAEDAQRIWEKLRQESSIDLNDVSLKGTEKASVRSLVLGVSVDGEDASALGVMSQGELHSLALSLFLPRAAAADSPFGFVVIDDPVQSMDPAKVTGLAQVLHELGKHRQVVVFTHDTRLQRAFTSQELEVTVSEVSRRKGSRVKITSVNDPVKQAIDDAMAIAKTQRLPDAARRHVLPSLCRIALENAFLEAAWIRHHRRGGDERDLLKAVDDAERFRKVAALALFGDVGRHRHVDAEVRSRYGPEAWALIQQCQQGAHPAGAGNRDPLGFVIEVEKLAQRVRKPEVGT